MDYPTIKKPPLADMKVMPNLVDSAGEKSSAVWDEVQKELSWLPGGGLNMAYECIDRHAVNLVWCRRNYAKGILMGAANEKC